MDNRRELVEKLWDFVLDNQDVPGIKGVQFLVYLLEEGKPLTSERAKYLEALLYQEEGGQHETR